MENSLFRLGHAVSTRAVGIPAPASRPRFKPEPFYPVAGRLAVLFDADEFRDRRHVQPKNVL